MTHFAQSDSHQWRGDSGEFVIQPCNTPGRLAALKLLSLGGNQLTSVPAELGRLTALKSLKLGSNQLTSVPAELGRAVQVDSITSRIPIAYGVRNQRLKLEYHKPVLPFAFNFNLLR
jgi:Leucine-rich repeat (LRR) protein